MSTFSFNRGIKNKLFGLMLVGVLVFALGLLTQGKERSKKGHGDHGEHHTETVEHHGEAHSPQDHHETDATHAVEEHAEEINEEEGNAVHHEAEILIEGHGHGEAEEQSHATGHEAHSEGEHGETHAPKVHKSFKNAPKHIMDTQLSGGHHGHHEPLTRAQQIKKILVNNLWVFAVMGFWMGAAALFFLAGHTIAWAGWYIQIQKVALAMTSLVPVAFILGVILFAVGKYDLFEWTHAYLFDPNHPEYDSLLALKRPFLNIPGFVIRSLVYFIVIMTLITLWWKNLRKQDESPSIKLFSKSRVLAACTIVLVAILDAFGTWDWVMSIEPHWYSTLYAWYNFASGAVAMLAAMILIILMLKKYDYLPNVNENHIHDIAKYMFAVTVFWAYLWFSQYMLIWYGNIPEETLYFRKRYEGYPILFMGAFLINFLLPFFILLKRSSKRNNAVLIFASVLVIIGHWFDFFNMIVVSNVPKGGFGLISIGIFLMIAGLFGFVVFAALSKVKDLESKRHPYYNESLNHHI